MLQVVELLLTVYRTNENMITGISNLDSRVLVIAVRPMLEFRNEFHFSHRITVICIQNARAAKKMLSRCLNVNVMS
jgi:translation elongation factor EF-1alpha